MLNARRHWIRAAALLCGASLLVAGTTALAVDFGWQQLPGGGIEYLVQVEPAMLDTFKQGGFASDIPAGLRDVRRISIVVGDEKLPNQGDIEGPKSAPAATPTADHEAKSEGIKTDAAPPASPPREESKTADDKAAVISPPATFGNPEPTADQTKASAPGLLNLSDLKKAIPFLQPTRTQSSTTTTPVAKPTENQDSIPPAPSQTQTAAANSPPQGLPRPEMTSESPTPSGNDTAAGYTPFSTARPETPVAATSDTGARPWLPLMLALLGLFLSLGANVYLGWIHQALRLKYRSLAVRQRAEVATII